MTLVATIAGLPVSKPQNPVPPGAWDCHAHVFGPFDRYPLGTQALYQPPRATAADNLARLDATGLCHAVLVQGAAHGFDNRVTLDAGKDGRSIGIAVVAPDATRDHLAQLDDQGACGLRFVDNGRTGTGILPLTALPDMAPMLRDLGWHAQVWAYLESILTRAKTWRDLDIPILLDHLGFPPLGTTPQTPIFRDFLALLRDSDIWVKLTPHRVSQDWPAAKDARRLHDAIVQAIPDRVVWGSDWPFLHLHDKLPDLGQRIDLLDQWCPDAALHQAIFVDNPHRLFGRYLNPQGRFAQDPN